MAIEDDQRNIAESIADISFRREFLYKVKNKDGDVVVCKPNAAQARLLETCHKRNIIPKARQHGITTCVCVFKMLDGCLFNDFYKGAIIAHRENDALKIFASKIKFPYEQIPQYLKDAGFVPKATRITTSSIEFDNGSIITADTMVRSDTLQYLHVSELAKMYQQFPTKAEEVKTGAIPAAEKGQIFIESTMEGRYGLMPDLCETALNLEREGRALTSKDFKFFFFPWFENPEYALDEVYPIPTRLREYFNALELEHGITLTDAQKRWYTAEEVIQGEKMKQEYPSVYEEAIEVATDAYYYQRLLNELRQSGRITTVPVDVNLPTITGWDLGYGDATAIWIAQPHGIFYRIVAYVENSGEGLAWYVNWLKRWQERFKVVFDFHFFPHDVKVHELSTGISRKQKLTEMGVKVTVLPLLPLDDGIELTRELLPNCYFDKESCGVGVKMLDGYSKRVSSDGLISQTPRHDATSHGADAFRSLAVGIKKYMSSLRGNRLSRDDVQERSRYYHK